MPDAGEENQGLGGLAVTGEQGGRMLACYIFSKKDHSDCNFLQAKSDESLDHFLKKQQNVYIAALYPAQARCLEKAISFLPNLLRGLATAQQAHMPRPDFDATPVPAAGMPAGDFRNDEDQYDGDFDVSAMPHRFPCGISAAHSRTISSSLQPRIGDIGQTPASRNEIRHGCIEAFREQQAFLGEAQADAVASCTPLAALFSEKKEGTRGRLLGLGQMLGALQFVNSKVLTSVYRESPDDDEGEVEAEKQTDVFQRHRERGAGCEAEPEPRRGWRSEPPARGSALVGWRTEGTYKTGKEMRWHEGFVIRYQMLMANGRNSKSERYQIAYHDGMSEWFDQFSEAGIAFRMQGDDACVSRTDVEHALRVHTL